jgi:hypothetical protein
LGGKSGASDQAAAQQNAQQQDAANARAQEQARQDRINTSMGNIRNAFEGSPVMANKSQAFDWGNWGKQTSQFGDYSKAGGQIDGTQVPGMPAGYTYKVIPGTGGATTVAAPGQAGGPAATGSTPYANTVGNAGMRAAGNVSTNPNQPNYTNSAASPGIAGMGGGTTTTAGTPTSYGIVGPDGKVYKQGDALSYNTSVDTGQRTGGFGDDFYNKQKQAVLDYYTPQVNDQYQKARDQTLFAEARAGSLGSRVSTLNTADLAKQYGVNMADVRNKADQAAANERANVAATRSKLESQALAGEDPDTAASQAVNASRNISLDQPSTSALGNIFQLATIGGANVLKGYNNAKLANSFSSDGSLPTSSGRPIS